MRAISLLDLDLDVVGFYAEIMQLLHKFVL